MSQRISVKYILAVQSRENSPVGLEKYRKKPWSLPSEALTDGFF